MCLDSARETPGEPGLGTAPPHGHAGDAPDEPGVAPAEFRRALARHAAGTVVVTGPGPLGFTATSFTAVSLHPPLVSFCVGLDSASWPKLREAGHFAVNLLAEHQRNVAERFAARNVDRFGPPTRWSEGPYGLPVLDGATAHLVCRRYVESALGDHMLVVGLLVATTLLPDKLPLLYHEGRFGGFNAQL